MKQPSPGPAFLIRLSATQDLGGPTGVATHIQSGERAAFVSLAELEQLIACWLEPADAEPDELELKAAKDIDEIER